jgi:hypothetical protein
MFFDLIFVFNSNIMVWIDSFANMDSFDDMDSMSIVWEVSIEANTEANTWDRMGNYKAIRSVCC